MISLYKDIDDEAEIGNYFADGEVIGVKQMGYLICKKECGNMSITNTLLSTAQKQLGTKESPPNSNKVKYNTWYYGREVSGSAYPWCMAFVQWCFNEAGAPLPYKTASCSALLNWYRKTRPECVVNTPQPGDIIIYNFGHTGIVESVGKSTITAIEGNTSSGSSGSQDNGGGVFRRTRSTSYVTAYIRPLAGGTTETEDNEMLTYEQWKAYQEQHRKELRDNDSGSWSAEARQWAIDNGLIVGNGTAPDGQPNFMWEDLLTREQAATLFHRFAQMLGRA